MALSQNAVEQISDNFLKQYPGLKNLNFEIFDSNAGVLPNNFPQDYVGGLIRGHNKILLFPDRFESPGEVTRVLRHETFSHYMFDCMSGEERQEMYSKVYDALLHDEDFKQRFNDMTKEYVNNDDYKLTHSEQTEEYFARIVESKIEITFTDKLTTKIKDIVRPYLEKVGCPIPFTETDAKVYIADFIEGVAEGKIQPSSQNMIARESNAIFVNHIQDRQEMAARFEQFGEQNNVTQKQSNNAPGVG